MNPGPKPVLLGILAIQLSVMFCGCGDPSARKENASTEVVPLTKPWEKAVPHQEVPEGLNSLSARSCGACHQEIYREWQSSTHAVAFQDLQFQAEMKKDGVLTCLNCHTPLQNQQEFIVKGHINGDYRTPLKEPNPRFDRELQLESISCATCHVRDGYVIGTSAESDAPHSTRQDTEFLSERLCIGCHNVSDELNPVLVCTFETGDEWRDNWASRSGKNCITCHMAETVRSIVPGMEQRESHVHYFPGSGIPKFPDMDVKGLEGLKITEGTIRKAYAVGELFNYSLTLKNNYAGHNLPTGDPERFYLITIRLTDGTNTVLKESTSRIGEEWEWYPVARKVSDNNLRPLEERTFSFEYLIEEEGAMTLTVQITKHRITEENARHNGILGEYPLFIKIYEELHPVVAK